MRANQSKAILFVIVVFVVVNDKMVFNHFLHLHSVNHNIVLRVLASGR